MYMRVASAEQDYERKMEACFREMHRVLRDDGVLTLGQEGWPWAEERLTAGFILDLRDDPAVGRCLLFFHG